MGDKPFDQAIDRAWEHFAQSLADTLGAESSTDLAWHRVDGFGNGHVRLLDARRLDSGRGCRLQVQVPASADRASQRRLRAVGLRIRSRVAAGRYRSTEDAAHAVVVALRDVWDLPHPAFAERILPGHSLGGRPRDLVGEITAAVGPEFAAVPHVGEARGVVAFRHSGGQVVIVRHDELLDTAEVNVLLASGADETEALVVSARLSAEFPEIEFRFSGGHLLAVRQFRIGPNDLDADALRDAVIELVALVMAEGPEIRARVGRPSSAEAPVTGAHDPRLRRLQEQCRQLDSQRAVEEALALSERSPDLLREWYREAVEARGVAVARHQRTGVCAAHLAHLRDELTWTTVSSIVAVALARLQIGTA